MPTFSMLRLSILAVTYARHAMPSAKLQPRRIHILRIHCMQHSPPLRTFPNNHMELQSYIAAEFIVDKVVRSSFNKQELSSSASQTVILLGYTLCKKFVELLFVLKDRNSYKGDIVVSLLQDMLEVVTCDMIVNEISVVIELGRGSNKRQFFVDTDPKPVVVFPLVGTAQWEEQISHLHLLLTLKESTTDVLLNLEARRRAPFITKSLFMEMPLPSRFRKILSFSVMTPYYSETVYSKSGLKQEKEDGVSILFYLQKILPDEWNNFMERINCKRVSEVWENEENILHLRHWVSLRGETLYRTVRGMVYYGIALKLQAFFDMANKKEILEGYKAFTVSEEDEQKSQRSMYGQLEAVADMKFTYVAQNCGNRKQCGDRRATDILNLMVNNPSLRVAYIDGVEEGEGKSRQKVYYSVLVKAVYNIDQDNYLEEAFKMRNLLEEFNEDHEVCPPSILGIWEHILTGSVMTPYYSEETVYTKSELEQENKDEWTNFMERINCKSASEVWDNEENVLHLHHWVSLRGQTPGRTVLPFNRGIRHGLLTMALFLVPAQWCLVEVMVLAEF